MSHQSPGAYLEEVETGPRPSPPVETGADRWAALEIDVLARLLHRLIVNVRIDFLTLDHDAGRAAMRSWRARDGDRDLASAVETFYPIMAVAADPLVARALRPPLSSTPIQVADRMALVVHSGPRYAAAWMLTSAGGFSPAEVDDAHVLLTGLRDASASVAFPTGRAGVLTDREVNILTLVGDGLTAVAIARRLGISTRTVHKHLERAYRKIGCHNRVSALRYLRTVNAWTALPS